MGYEIEGKKLGRGNLNKKHSQKNNARKITTDRIC
jgi:hypothetical protein